MKQRNTIFAVVLTLATLLLAACGSSSSSGGGGSPSGNVTFWYTEGKTEEPAILKIVSDFNAANPKIKVTAQYVDFNSAHDKFATAAKAGSGAPDVIRTDIAWTSEFAKNGYLLDLTNKITGGTSDFLPAPLAYNQYNGKLYGVPEVTDFLVLYYNKALVPTPPTTLDQLRTMAKSLTDKAKGQYGFATEGGSYFVTPWLFADGGGLVSDDGKTIFVNSAGSVSGFQRLLDLNKDGSLQPIDFKNGYTNSNEGFKSGKVAMLFNGPWQASDLVTGSAFAGANAANFGVAAIPTGTAGDVPRSPTGGQNYSVYAGSSAPEAAVAFLNYLDSAQSQIAVATANGTLPARQSAYADPGVIANKTIAAFKPLLTSAKSRPVNPNAGSIFTAFDADIQNALTGKDTSQGALDKVAKDWAPLFNS
ncbi:MAG: extracellular solute-binding protein [Ktedonobacterales bacterium]|nr:extracellular solute-binding protein [Ktedonobacterales bacterium]